jgi:hypothetical protein
MSSVAESPLVINPSMPVADARAVCKKAVDAGYCSQESADAALETYFAARAQNVGVAGSRRDGKANGKPLVRRDGTPQPGDKDGRPYRLTRRKPGKEGPGYPDNVYFTVMPGAEVKGKHFAGGLNIAVPLLEALVGKYNAGGIFAAALKDYHDKSICYSRERDEE